MLIILLVVFLGLTAYFTANHYLFTKRHHAAEVIPADAIFVFETTDPVNAWNQLVIQPIWSRLNDIPSLTRLEHQLLDLDSLAGKSGKLESSLKGNKLAISLHRSAKERFDFLFSIAFSGNQHKEIIASLTKEIDPRSIRSRNYSGVEILEYHSQEQTRPLSYAIIDNLLLGSYSSFLLEDAIRYAQSKELKGFKEASPALYKNQPEPRGLGLLRLSSVGIAKFIYSITDGSQLKELDYFSANHLMANLELKLEDNEIAFQGSSFFADGEPVDIPMNANNKTKTFSNYISNRTAVFHRYNVMDPFQIQAIPTPAFEATTTLEGEMEKNFPEDSFFKRLTGEVGYMVLEEGNSLEKERLLLLKTSEVEKQVDLLKEFNWTLMGKDLNQLEQDIHLGRRIFGIATEEFPAHIFDGQFVGFPHTYVTAYDDMLIMGNSIKAVRIFLDDIYDDNTWGKSIYHKRFLETVPPESAYDYILSVPRFWSFITESASPEWKVFLQKYAPQLKSVNWVLLQQKGADTEVEFQYLLDSIKPVTDIVLAEDMTVRFDEALIYGPKGIQNFNDKSRDYLVQDDLHQVHLVTNEGDVLFSQQVEGEITGDIFQIDYYKNGKLQLLFATTDAIYALDRTGALLPDYPIRIPSGLDIEFLALVDYDKELDYRYFVGLADGTLFLFDKNGNPLDGWSPRYTSGQLAAAPEHHRISRVGDFMIAVNTSGDLYLMNRKGELKSENPLKLGAGISTDYAIAENSRASDTQLVTINQEGEVIKANFNGEITYRNQLLRPDRDTRFHLVKSQSNTNYLFVLHEYNKISVLDAEEKPVFEKGGFSDNLKFQYFSFGGGKDIFVVIDKVQEFIYLYNFRGQLLNTRPLSGADQVEISYSASNNGYSIFTIHENRMVVYTMPL